MSLSKIQCLSKSQKGPYQIFQFLSFSNKGVKLPIFPLTDHLDSKFSPEGPNASLRADGPNLTRTTNVVRNADAHVLDTL